MKKKLGILCLILIIVTGLGVTVTAVRQVDIQDKKEKLTIVTSFYPIYIAAVNLTDGLENVEVVNLTENAGGCLHDYQLTTNDMKTLEQADIFIMNGGGMEGFVQDVIKAYPDLKIVDSSEGIELLESITEHNHEEEEISSEHLHEGEEEISSGHLHEEEEHDHGVYNAHMWLSPTLYVQQIENIKDGLCKWDEKNASGYVENAKAYEKKVKALQDEIKAQLSNPKNTEAIIFHDSFAYLAKELGIEIVYAIDMDGDTSLGAGQVAEIVDEVNLHQIKLLFTEEQFKDMIAKSVSEETGANVYVIDSLVSGEWDKDAYIRGMENNIKVLKEALYQ